MCFVKAAARIIKIKKNMVDILPETQAVIGHGAFSVVYKACLKAVSDFLFYIDVVSCCFYFRFQIFSFQTNNCDDKKFQRKTLLAKLQLIWFKKQSFIPFIYSTCILVNKKHLHLLLYKISCPINYAKYTASIVFNANCNPILLIFA